jgi:hypothetical protein
VTATPKDATRPGPALITGFAIEGIPAENISIDQPAKIITVVVPEVPYSCLIDAVNMSGYLSFGPDAGFPGFTLPTTHNSDSSHCAIRK